MPRRSSLRFITLTIMLVTCCGLAWAAPEVEFRPQAPFSNGAVVDRDRDTEFVFSSFEDAVPPAGWNLVTPAGEAVSWIHYQGIAHSGQNSALALPIGAPRDQTLVLPPLDFSTALAPKLSLWELGYAWYFYTDIHHQIVYATSEPTVPEDFTVLVDWTPDNHDMIDYHWQEAEADLSPLAGEPVVYLGIRLLDPSAEFDIWIIDDVTVYDVEAVDATVVNVMPDGLQYGAGSVITPEVVVKNRGLTPATFAVSLEILESGASVYYQTATATDLAHWEEALLAFPNLTLSAGNYYDLVATTMLPGDEVPENDEQRGLVDTYTGPHVPVGFLFTNSGCGPCVQANQALDSYTETSGNSAGVLRLHVWWPNPADIMYLANPGQVDALIVEYGIFAVPWGYVDGHRVEVSDAVAVPDMLEEAKNRFSPLQVTPLVWNAGEDVLTVAIDIIEPLPDRDFRLFCNITEDGIEHDGGNGEPIHNQAFRYMYPNLEGIPIATDLGNEVYTVSMPLDPAWVYGNLRATVYVQMMETGRIWETGTDFLTEIDDVVSIEDDEIADDSVAPDHTPQLVTGLRGAQPNPFNPMTTVFFTVASPQHVTLSVFDMSGHRVAELANGVFAAGEHPVQWNGKDADGRDVSSGPYLIYMESETRTYSSKLMLVR